MSGNSFFCGANVSFAVGRERGISINRLIQICSLAASRMLAPQMLVNNTCGANVSFAVGKEHRISIDRLLQIYSLKASRMLAPQMVAIIVGRTSRSPSE